MNQERREEWDAIFGSHIPGNQSRDSTNAGPYSDHVDALGYLKREKKSSSAQTIQNVNLPSSSGFFKIEEPVKRVKRPNLSFELCPRTVNHKHTYHPSKRVCEACGAIDPLYFYTLFKRGRRIRITWKQWCQLREIVNNRWL